MSFDPLSLLSIGTKFWPFHRCKKFTFIRNLYGDQINIFGGRSMWKCQDCGKTRICGDLADE